MRERGDCVTLGSLPGPWAVRPGLTGWPATTFTKQVSHSLLTLGLLLEARYELNVQAARAIVSSKAQLHGPLCSAYAIFTLFAFNLRIRGQH